MRAALACLLAAAAFAGESVAAVGTLRPRLRAELGSTVSGRVERVLVDVGAAVAAGDELVVLDHALIEREREVARAAVQVAEARAATATAAVEAVRAEVPAAEAEVADAALALERARAMAEKPPGEEPTAPRKLLDDARTRTAQAAARLAAARARVLQAEAGGREAAAGLVQAQAVLAQAGQRLAETVIRAPFAGVVARRLVDPGAQVTAQPATVLLELQDTAELHLEFAVPETAGHRLRAGQEVRLRLPGAEAETAAAIERIFPALDGNGVRCRILVPNPGGTLRPGSLVPVTVPLG